MIGSLANSPGAYLGLEEPKRRSVHEDVEVEEFERVWAYVGQKDVRRTIDDGFRACRLPLTLRRHRRERAGARVRAVRADMLSKSGMR